MIILYDNLFTHQELELIKNEILERDNKKSFIIEKDTYSEYSKGYGILPIVNNFGEQFTDIIVKDFGKNIEYYCSYSRIYLNSGTLKPHVDRWGLDITLSVNIFSTLSEPWPIHVSEKEYLGERGVVIPEEFLTPFRSVLLKPGQGVAIFGTKSPHWRDQLVCGENDYVIQIFYHWRVVN